MQRLSILAALLFVQINGQAQDEPIESKAAEVRRGTFIPQSLEVVPFVPPITPAVQRVPSALRVDAGTSVRLENGHTLTSVRAQASTAPDLPDGDQLAVASTDLEVGGIQHAPPPAAQLIMMGATVFGREISLANWTDRETGENYEALCRFDLGLLAGIGEFRVDDRPANLILVHSNSPSRDFPELADVPDGGLLVVKGDPDSISGMAPILALRDVIAVEKSRLIAFQAARQEKLAAQAAWEKAHPAEPQDMVFWYRPHRGSRYLSDPFPEKKPSARISKPQRGRLDLLTSRRVRTSQSSKASDEPIQLPPPSSAQ
ncbi:hypothetical protein JIN85_16145 [Luteolibacter pohnpeiensis]|uniref:Uncharacterized protein n=1 Tax=Luteolibacter pohnpeiensis TaxID=454153 RepID=A0A934SAL4_9BACT|nr:hypothetical protein [Luteolibacter pohnpeiensis]MBK1883951.1 hypothetical protein [Luteolibacter pohnpeiensis]